MGAFFAFTGLPFFAAAFLGAAAFGDPVFFFMMQS